MKRKNRGYDPSMINFLVTLSTRCFHYFILQIGHKCGACDKVFSLRKNLYQHLRNIHGKTDIGRYGPNSGVSIRLICDACGVGFGERKSLTRHLRMKHSVDVSREKKSVATCIHCNTTFAHLKSLYKHERKFHRAGYKKIVKDSLNEADGGIRKINEKIENIGVIDDYPYLKV